MADGFNGAAVTAATAADVNASASVAVQPLQPRHRVFLLDIEGTTTPISFVHDVLFPYVTDNIERYLQQQQQEPQTIADIAALVAYGQANHADRFVGYELLSSEQQLSVVSSYVIFLVRSDVKATALKQLQGAMWKHGYASKQFTSIVYDDVVAAYKRWSSAQQRIYIYSSGSIGAQKLLFTHSTHGDLTTFISGYYDTTSGLKQSEQSYQNIYSSIAAQLQADSEPLLKRSDIVFLTDIHSEAVAAAAAGLDVIVIVRPGNHPLPLDNAFVTMTSFDDIN